MEKEYWKEKYSDKIYPYLRDCDKAITLKHYIDVINKNDNRSLKIFKHEVQLCEHYDGYNYKNHVEIIFGLNNGVVVVDDDGEIDDNDERYNYKIIEVFMTLE